jgi:hypothetical protein
VYIKAIMMEKISYVIKRILKPIAKKPLLVIILSFSLLETEAQKVKIIEFGWDYPDVTQLSRRLDSMQNTPFDGICFSLQRKIMESFDTSLQQNSYFQFNKLPSLKWGKYSNNFIIVRGFSKTGGNWFDDIAWQNISSNMVNLSRAMQIGNLSGILFDPEYYYENKLFNPWTFSQAQYPGKTLAEVQNQVKRRGQQFIASLQKVKSSFTFISIWMASLIAQEKKYTPLDKTRHILLISFIEGMLENKNNGVTMTDGNEYAYSNATPSQFFDAKSLLRNTMIELLHSEKSKKEAENIEIAQPVFYDGLMGTTPFFDKGLKRSLKWKWLNENIKYAIASSDHYVWFYCQHINWWNGTANDTALAILQKDKSAFVDNNTRPNYGYKSSFVATTGYNNVNSNQGYYNATVEEKNERAFDFNWDSKQKKLRVNFRDKIPVATSIYINNTIAKQLTPSNLNVRVSIPAFTTGVLAIINTYRDKTESSAIYVLK